MQLTVTQSSWPIRGSFTISRGSRTQADVVSVELTDGDCQGRGECVPYARYGESPASVIAQIEQVRRVLEGGLDRDGLQRALPAGAARNALDCAMWDLESKKAGCRVWQLPEIASTLKPLATAYTLSLDTPAAMKASAAANQHRPLLKVKLGGGR